MDKVNKQELRRLAEAQQAKVWSRTRGRMRVMEPAKLMYSVTGPEAVSDYEDWGFSAKAASYIAAANPAAILSLLDEIASLRDLLAEKVINSTALTEFVANNGGAHLGMEGGACALFAHVFGQQLYESKAINYIEATFESPQHPDLGQITVTLKRESGKTPHQLRLQAEAELEQYRKDAESLRGSCKALGEQNKHLTRRVKALARAVKWLADTGWGVARPKWLTAILAKEGGANG